MSQTPHIKVRSLNSFQSEGVRSAQEDHLFNDVERGIFVVADGFGGPQIGALASKNACEAVNNFLVKEAGDLDATLPFVLRSYFSLVGNVLFNALVHANRKLFAQNKGKSIYDRAGASVLAGYLDGEFLALANVGACSAWLFRNGEVAELVTPRTYARLSDPFAKIPREGLRVPLMALGISEDLEPEIFEYRIQKGDWLLLSTDGLLDEMEPIFSEIQKLQFQGPLSEKISSELESVFKSKRFKDNLALSLVIF